MAGGHLELHGVGRRYGARWAVRDVTLDAPEGSALALMGPNGSGKTSLLRIMAGRDVASTGSVTIDGRPFTEDDEWVRRQMGVVAEDVAFYPDLTVLEHLWLVACAHGAGGRATELAWDVLDELRLAEHAESLPQELSSGQQQALLLATVLVRPRRLLLLDEPERRLDAAARRRLANRLVAERDAGVTVVVATHHVELAAALADHVALLAEGQVTAKGPASAVLATLLDDS